MQKRHKIKDLSAMFGRGVFFLSRFYTSGVYPAFFADNPHAPHIIKTLREQGVLCVETNGTIYIIPKGE